VEPEPSALLETVSRPLHAPPPPPIVLGTTETGPVGPTFVSDTQEKIASIVSTLVPTAKTLPEDIEKIGGLPEFLADFERDNVAFSLSIPDESGKLPPVSPGTTVINVALTSGETVQVGLTPSDSASPPDSIVVVARHSKIRTPPNTNVIQYLNEV
jgi:hypothetical protein